MLLFISIRFELKNTNLVSIRLNLIQNFGFSNVSFAKELEQHLMQETSTVDQVGKPKRTDSFSIKHFKTFRYGRLS